jgi:hypothetical protein
MPVPSSWGSINRETSTIHALAASTRPCLSWIKRERLGQSEAHVPRGAHAGHAGFRSMRRNRGTILNRPGPPGGNGPRPLKILNPALRHLLDWRWQCHAFS